MDKDIKLIDIELRHHVFRQGPIAVIQQRPGGEVSFSLRDKTPGSHETMIRHFGAAYPDHKFMLRYIGTEIPENDGFIVTDMSVNQLLGALWEQKLIDHDQMIRAAKAMAKPSKFLSIGNRPPPADISQPIGFGR